MPSDLVEGVPKLHFLIKSFYSMVEPRSRSHWEDVGVSIFIIHTSLSYCTVSLRGILPTAFFSCYYEMVSKLSMFSVDCRLISYPAWSLSNDEFFSGILMEKKLV